ncbi:MAG: hypothetical protein P8Q37_07555 [Porticoccaceae bacterium]|nr:hypothetical protein [Porticoccaceae bacterium]MDG1474746.1 hypothetical protein [Porticoccaceae bacterium]
MSDDFDDLAPEADQDNDTSKSHVEGKLTLTEKKRSERLSDARRRLELRLEQQLIEKQLKAFDFEDDFE